MIHCRYRAATKGVFSQMNNRSDVSIVEGVKSVIRLASVKLFKFPSEVTSSGCNLDLSIAKVADEPVNPCWFCPRYD